MKNIAFVMSMVAAAIAGCGGGGDDSTPPDLTFNGDAAYANALSKGISFSNMPAATPAGNALISLSITPTTDAAIAGTTYKRAIQTVTVQIGATTGSASSTLYYAVNPARLTFSSEASTGNFAAHTLITPLPTAGKVGQSGTFLQSTAYTSSSRTTQIGTGNTSWSIEPDTATTALLCLNLSSVIRGAITTEKDCYRSDAAGNITGIKASGTSAGISLNFQSF